MIRLRNPLRRIVPSMFHRRLLLLAAGMVLVTTAMLSQMAYLTMVDAGQWRDKAESRLVQHAFIPTARGRILDRRQRVLAEDRPAYDVAVRYEVLTGRWAYRMALADARKDTRRGNAGRWNQMDSRQRDELVRDYLPPYRAQVDRMWNELSQFGGVDRVELERVRAAIIEKVQNLKSHLWLQWYRKESQTTSGPLLLADVAAPIAEELDAHPILRAVHPETKLAVMRKSAEAEGDLQSVWHQVRVIDSERRSYPFETVTVRVDRSTLPAPLRRPEPAEIEVGGVGIHIIGGIRPLWPEDPWLTERPFVKKDDAGRSEVDLGGYRAGDDVGGWGVERSRENRLHGRRGELTRDRQTDAADRVEPVAGQDVTLSIDVLLQARITAIMGNAPATGVGLMQRQDWHERTVSAGDIGQPLHGAAV
ncbi:MAG: hypothetical protein IT440_03295, partial [Phycisphaeraceae bacterium]|nr:hypothetical protein [Phycisphaeraceae bacterium]